MSEEIERAVREMERAHDNLARSGGKGGSGAESRYGEAYQALVALGERPQIRLKYRGAAG